MAKPKGVSRFFDYFDVLVSLGIALFILKLWIFPQQDDIGDILTLCLIMVVEFIMVHSGAMMAFARSFSRFLPLVFVPLYGLFIWAFYLAAGDVNIVWLYCFAVFCRLCGGFFSSDPGVLARQFKCAFFHAMIYFAAFVLVGTGAGRPLRFGLTEPFLAAANYYSRAEDAYGMLLQTPHVTLCFAFVYYMGLAAFDFWVAKNPRQT